MESESESEWEEEYCSSEGSDARDADDDSGEDRAANASADDGDAVSDGGRLFALATDQENEIAVVSAMLDRECCAK